MNAVELIKVRETTQSDLAQQAGFKSRSNITGMLNKNKGGIRIGNLYKLLEALDCDIVVCGKNNPDEKWVITYSAEELEEMRY